MADLTEKPQWVEGIYQLETADPVLGGSDGIANRQAKQLGNRTAWLKSQYQQQQQAQEMAIIKLVTVQIDNMYRQIRQEYRLLDMESRSTSCH